MKVIGSKRKSKMGEIDYGIFYTVALLLTIGVVMVYSASSYYAMFMYKDSMFFLKKRINGRGCWSYSDGSSDEC